MATSTPRLYVVETTDGSVTRLVRASHRYMAERHVWKPMFKSRLASKQDIERLIIAGVKPEDADDTPGLPQD